MSKFKLITLFSLFLVIHVNISSAAVNLSDIANNFIQAVQSKDKLKIDLAFNELATNLEAQEILKNDHPDYFTLFNFYKLSQNIKDLKANYGSSSVNKAISSVITPRTSKGLSSNKDLDFSRNTSNRIVARQRDLSSNGDIVRSNPNQDQESNQERIRRRR